jgi:hypothetical protein
VTPCLMPALESIRHIKVAMVAFETDAFVLVTCTRQVASPRYYPLCIPVSSSPSHAASLQNSRQIFVKRKTGHLSYGDDGRGVRSLLARAFPKNTGLYEDVPLLILTP